MSLFGLKSLSSRYGVVIDIGSGSVLVSIIHSDNSLPHPTIVWSHREHAPLKNIDSLEQSSKAVITALVNASMILEAEGRKVLHEYDHGAKLTDMQCSISAPWSYTVTKNINYKQDGLFSVTEDLIEDLTITAQDKINAELKETSNLSELGLSLVAKGTMDLLVNGYHINNPVKGKAKELSVVLTNAVAHDYLVNAVDELRDKLFPNVESKKISFILMLHSVTKELLNQAYDVCLVDVTYEATEIGIVRDGSLQYSTHASFGSFSIAREISAITGVPLHEALGYLHTEKPYSFMQKLNKAQHDEVEAVFESYTQKITNLFHETGDELSIPKKISLHSDLDSETLFLDLIEKAARRCLKSDPSVTTISKEIIKQTYTESTKESKIKTPTDTALLLSAQFFHKHNKSQSFQYL
ncbi:hypothetical protein KC926_00370 [Candidatus Kaiserbacteria bacterium]|nr:hypothetical protein [Candidatus Kaiserbacteria bacterium]